MDEYEAVAGGGSNTRINQWSYDDSYRLLSESRQLNGGTATTASYSYDKTGNRLSMATTGLPSVSYTYNELDQLTSTQSGSVISQYGYDRRGNLKQLTSGSSVTNYTWDAQDRLVGAVMPGGSASYTYDHDNRRVKQVASGTTTNYLWDEQSQYGDVLLETDTAGAIQTSYTLGGAELVSQKKAGTLNYFLTDGQGSTRNLSDSSGALVSGQQYSYDAFGKLLSGQTSPASNYLYTGQQFDALSGLYSLRARYYNPGEGRFLSRDVWLVDYENPVELNRYVYTANNPINYNDPSGNFYGLVSFWRSLSTQQQTLIILSAAIFTALSYVLPRYKITWKGPDHISYDTPPSDAYDNPRSLPRVQNPTYAEKGGEIGIHDDDWRGQDRTLEEALEKARKNAGVPDGNDWKPTQYAPDKYGKNHPVAWEGPNGEKLNIDQYYPGIDGPKDPHVGWEDGGKRWRGGKRGHILIDNVPRARPPIGQDR